MEGGDIRLSLLFSSYPRFVSVRWYKDGMELDVRGNDDLIATTESALVTHVFHGKSVTMPGYASTLYIRSPEYEWYTTYKVTAENKIGHTTHFITVQNPYESKLH